MKYYRDKKHDKFSLSAYSMALFDSEGNQRHRFNCTQHNGFLSTLALTQSSLPKGLYSIMI
jgi:hypothetical protein